MRSEMRVLLAAYASVIRAVYAADLFPFSHVTRTAISIRKRPWELELVLWPEAGDDDGKEPFGFVLRVMRGEERLLLEVRLDLDDGRSFAVFQCTQGLRDQAIQILPSFASAGTLVERQCQCPPFEPSVQGELSLPPFPPDDRIAQVTYAMGIPSETLFEVIEGMVMPVAEEVCSAEF